MEWPSRRVAPGGLFQPAKVNYSPETRDFLKELINESKLSITQRQKVNYSLRSGEPLPPLNNKSENSRRFPKVTIRPGTSKKRTHYTIVQSGAYEREKFIPQHPKVDREKVKQHLQDLMAFGRDAGRKSPRDKRKPKAKGEEKESRPEENRFDQLVREIKERKEWYKTMVDLGEGLKYKTMIEQQIHAKMREMENLKEAEKQGDK